MANLPQNDTYNSTKKNFVPSSRYKNLSGILRSGGSMRPTYIPTSSSEAEYKDLIRSLQQIEGRERNAPVREQFRPEEDGTTSATPIPVPSDAKFRSANPLTGTVDPISPEIRAIKGGLDQPGQIVMDTAQKGALIKFDRGDSSVLHNAIRAGRSSSLYQVDHTIPLALGGADTPENRQLLTITDHDKKTRVQAVAYTLYLKGDISKNEAIVMSGNWTDKKYDDIPQPDKNGMIDYDLAKKKRQEWSTVQKPKLFSKEFFAAVPSVMENLGGDKLDDNKKSRAFLQGAANALTFGFVPSGFKGEEATTKEKISYGVGGVLGTIGSFALGGVLLRGAGYGLRGLGALGSKIPGVASGMEAAGSTFNAVRTRAAGEAVKSGVSIADDVMTIPLKKPSTAQRALAQLNPFASLMKVSGAEGMYTVPKTVKTLNSSPTYWQYLRTPEGAASILKKGSKLGVAFTALEAGRLGIQYKFNTEILAGEKEPQDIDRLGAKLAASWFYGTAGAVIPGGVSLSGLTTAAVFGFSTYVIERMINPDESHDSSAAITGWTMGAFQMIGGPRTKTILDAVQSQQVNVMKDMARKNLEFYAPELSSTLKEGVELTNDQIIEAVNTARSNATRMFFRETPMASGEPIMTQDALEAELKRIALAGEALKFDSTVQRLQQSAIEGGSTLDEALSFGQAKNNVSQINQRFKSLDTVSQPAKVRAVADSIIKDPESATLAQAYSKQTPSGKYMVGDVAVTGPSLHKDVNQPFFDALDNSQYKVRVVISRDRESAPLWRMRNYDITQNPSVYKGYVTDPNPEKTLRVSAIIEDVDGQVQVVSLDHVASEHRLNTAENAINRAEITKDWDLDKIQYNKDQLADEMDRVGTDFLVANIDPRTTQATKTTENRFIVLNFSDANWEYTLKKMEDKVFERAYKYATFESNVKAYNEATSPVLKKQILSAINSQNRTNPSALLPERIPGFTEYEAISTPAKKLLEGLESTFSSKTEVELGQKLNEQFGIRLGAEEARQMFKKQYTMTVKDALDFIRLQLNAKNANIKTAMQFNIFNEYLNSPMYTNSPLKKVFKDLRLNAGNAELMKKRGIDLDKLPESLALRAKTLKSVVDEVKAKPIKKDPTTPVVESKVDAVPQKTEDVKSQLLGPTAMADEVPPVAGGTGVTPVTTVAKTTPSQASLPGIIDPGPSVTPVSQAAKRDLSNKIVLSKKQVESLKEPSVSSSFGPAQKNRPQNNAVNFDKNKYTDNLVNSAIDEIETKTFKEGTNYDIKKVKTEYGRVLQKIEEMVDDDYARDRGMFRGVTKQNIEEIKSNIRDRINKAISLQVESAETPASDILADNYIEFFSDNGAKNAINLLPSLIDDTKGTARTGLINRVVKNAEIALAKDFRIPVRDKESILLNIRQNLDDMFGASIPQDKVINNIESALVSRYTGRAVDNIKTMATKYGQNIPLDAQKNIMDKVLGEFDEYVVKLNLSSKNRSNVIDRSRESIKNSITSRLNNIGETLKLPSGEKVSKQDLVDPNAGAYSSPLWEKSGDIDATLAPANSKEFIDSIDKGLNEPKSKNSYWFARSFDEAFKLMFGVNWRTSKDARKYLSTQTEEGRELWKSFNRSINPEGREITQPKDILRARGEGSQVKEDLAMLNRREQIKSSQQKEAPKQLPVNGNVSKTDLKGLTTFDGQLEEEMVRDLTKGESLLANISLNEGLTPEKVSQDVKSLILGRRNAPGFISIINKDRQKANLPSVYLDEASYDKKVLKQSATASKLVDRLEDLEGRVKYEVQPERRAELEKEIDILRRKLGMNNVINEKTPAEKVISTGKSILDLIIRKNSPKNDGQGGPGYDKLMNKLTEFKDKTVNTGQKMYSNIDSMINSKQKQRESQETQREEVRNKRQEDKMSRDKAIESKTSEVIGSLPTGAISSAQLEGKTPAQKYFNLQDQIKKLNLPATQSGVNVVDPSKTFNVRGVKITGSDLNELIPVIFAETYSHQDPTALAKEVKDIFNVVLNRSKDGKWPNEITKIIKQPSQFQGISNPQYQLAKNPTKEGPSKTKYDTIVKTINQIISSGVEDTVNNDVFFMHDKFGRLHTSKDFTELQARVEKINAGSLR